MSLVPCPKPGCGWTVDPATVPAGGIVTCPKCGQRFRLATPAPTPTGRRDGIGSSLLAVGGVLLAVAVLAGVVMTAVLLKKNLGGDTPTGAASADIRDADRNFSFTPPGGDWAADPDTRTALGVNVVALHRTAAPEACAALAVKDFGSRTPLASELRDQMTATLSRVLDDLPAEPLLEPTTWAGQPAMVWKFRGQHKATGTVSAGEAVTTTFRGVGYWFYGWAAERDYDPAASAKVRDGFRLLDGRANWAPTAASEVTFRSQAGGYRLTAYEKIWDLVPTPADGPELELKGVLRSRGKRDFPPRAEVRVWRRADAGDPMSVADALVRKENTRDAEAFGKSEFTELTDPPAGDAPPGPDDLPATPVRRLNVTYGSDDTGKTRRLLAFAAVRVGGDVVVAAASCPWDEREVWERRLVQLLGSLK